MTNRPHGMSQLDYLWTHFGESTLSTEVSKTPSDDVILTEKAIVELVANSGETLSSGDRLSKVVFVYQYDNTTYEKYPPRRVDDKTYDSSTNAPVEGDPYLIIQYYNTLGTQKYYFNDYTSLKSLIDASDQKCEELEKELDELSGKLEEYIEYGQVKWTTLK